MKLYCAGNILADNVRGADNFLSRFIGLMNRKCLGPQEGLFLKNCSSIHCFFMKIPIDVIYLSKSMDVLYVETVRPWRIGSFIKNTTHILELSAGKAQGWVRIGDRLKIIGE